MSTDVQRADITGSDETGDFVVMRDGSVALSAWPDGLFAGSRPSTVPQLRAADGRNVVLNVERWHQPATPDDHQALARASGAVLDIGCGPGRHVVALQGQGCEALGIDISPAAVRAARRRGAHAIVASVWDRLPQSGYWQSALLLDGNIGIGGNPAALLERTVSHLGGARRVIVELAAGRFAGSITVQVTQEALRGPWFRWAVVTPSTIHPVALSGGMIVQELWTSAAGRCFAVLTPAGTVAQPWAMEPDRTAVDPPAGDTTEPLAGGSPSTMRSGGFGGVIVAPDPTTRRRPGVGPNREPWDRSSLDRAPRCAAGLTVSLAADDDLAAVDG